MEKGMIEGLGRVGNYGGGFGKRVIGDLREVLEEVRSLDREKPWLKRFGEGGIRKLDGLRYAVEALLEEAEGEVFWEFPRDRDPGMFVRYLRFSKGSKETKNTILHSLSVQTESILEALETLAEIAVEKRKCDRNRYSVDTEDITEARDLLSALAIQAIRRLDGIYDEGSPEDAIVRWMLEHLPVFREYPKEFGWPSMKLVFWASFENDYGGVLEKSRWIDDFIRKISKDGKDFCVFIAKKNTIAKSEILNFIKRNKLEIVIEQEKNFVIVLSNRRGAGFDDVLLIKSSEKEFEDPGSRSEIEQVVALFLDGWLPRTMKENSKIVKAGEISGRQHLADPDFRKSLSITGHQRP